MVLLKATLITPSSDQITVLQQAEESGGSVTSQTFAKMGWDKSRL